MITQDPVIFPSPRRAKVKRSNSDKYLQNRRVESITRLAQQLSPRQIATIIAKADEGDPATVDALARDSVSVEDLRELLAARSCANVLRQFRWRGKWTGTAPKLFIVTDDVDRYVRFVERHQLDPYRTFFYSDAAECWRDVAQNEEANVRVEVLILGGAGR